MVYIAQDIDNFLKSIVEVAVLFAGLKRKDAPKDETVGGMKI